MSIKVWKELSSTFCWSILQDPGWRVIFFLCRLKKKFLRTWQNMRWLFKTLRGRWHLLILFIFYLPMPDTWLSKNFIQWERQILPYAQNESKYQIFVDSFSRERVNGTYMSESTRFREKVNVVFLVRTVPQSGLRPTHI